MPRIYFVNLTKSQVSFSKPAGSSASSFCMWQKAGLVPRVAFTSGADHRAPPQNAAVERGAAIRARLPGGHATWAESSAAV